MSTPPLSPEVQEMLRQPNPCVMATVRADGSPVSAATWYLWEDGRVLVNMDDGRVRLNHLRHDPRVTLTVLSSDSWYTHVTLVGRAVEIKADEGLADINRISTHYAGGAYPDQVRPRTSVWIEVDRWYGWGTLNNTDQATAKAE